MPVSDLSRLDRPTPGALSIGVAGLRGLPEVMGGIETHCEELYPRLLDLQPDFRIICVARRPYVGRRDPYCWQGIRVVPLPSTRSSAFEALLNTLCAILYFGLRRRPDLLQIHAIGPALLTPLAKLLGLRVVITHHGRDYNRAKWNGFARAMLRTGEWAAMRFADRVIAVADTLATELRRDFPERANRVVYIPNGVSLPAQSEGVADDFLARFGLTAGNYVLSVGRLVPEKGFADLIAGHARSGLDRKLVIAGGADHQTPFVRSILALASERVVFTGMQPRGQLAKLYAGAGLFVLASHHEGLPIAALEAAAAGVPLLLSDIAPNRDLMLPPAHYYPAGDVAALGEKLARPWADYAIDGPAVAARFDWDRIAKNTLAMYEEVAPCSDLVRRRKNSVRRHAVM